MEYNSFNLAKIDRVPSTNSNIDIKLEATPQPHPDFSLEYFLFRFWCGDSALREDRYVTRKRLALQAVGVDNGDRDALRLNNQIRAYQQAYELVLNADNVTLDLICRINGLVCTQHKESGRIRSSQNFVGKRDNQPVYVPPSTGALPDLVDDLISYINDDSIEAIPRMIVAHSQFLLIHPFQDGNGRTARIIMDAMLYRTYGASYLSLSLQRLDNNARYIDTIQKFKTNIPKGLGDSYWAEGFSLISSFKDEANQIIKQADLEIKGKLAFFDHDKDVLSLCRTLWQRPIIYQQDIPGCEFWTEGRLAKAVNTLVQAGILSLRKLLKPEGEMILECPIIFKAWKKIDDMVLGIQES
ncbi:Fic family protein [Pseudobacteriovorax antillogorgiicola]|uniref:Fic/DOC family protein n=1 Tax=Pseudobacteriovorax antillogorgiicola TaxID=1513793 RepID=A0A1Y6C4N4_9BACT|nr:Fic family protein [Pseudobacteriovorax antillogorgiicola]TCS49860.1 Fic/DOC family protein [Pseudobacteriovorax antillogorgiicola]SMF43782.1 Fic/DOC family protein [Pseudobacteriovorax antillogorgiicola]